MGDLEPHLAVHLQEGGMVMNTDWLNTHETIDNDARRHVLSATDVAVIWAIGLRMYLEAHGLKEAG